MSTPDELREVPALTRYVEGWGRPGDIGVVGGMDGVLLGAAWVRVFDAEEAGYGYVAEGIPELAIGVAPESRGFGIGTTVLSALLDNLRPVYQGVSLSVRLENPARKLYERLGFVDVPDSEHRNRAGSTSVTMYTVFDAD
ncbi:GNAT family N-acetyltransferase [Nocardia sp. NPDC088792]|uniref:GNAT family N-acetyltransferase n=1 Tax=Nocardia sp. NPDC088792 TaxID=3364332 RepID=UPI00381B6D9B